MIQVQPLSEIALLRESLKRLCSENSTLYRTERVLELVAHSSVGLGEVLQDYANQTSRQLHSFIRAGQNVTAGYGLKGDAEALGNVHFLLKTIKSVLEKIPAAMQRNKAEMLSEKDQVGRAEILRVTHDFVHSPDVTRLLASENSGDVLASLVPAVDTAGGHGSGQGQVLAAASH